MKLIVQEKFNLDYLVEKLAEVDTFDYQSLAKSTAESLIDPLPPFVYAICGPWGTGKSSFIKFLIQCFPEREGTNNLFLYCNAWRLSYSNNITTLFLRHLIKQIEDTAFANQVIPKQEQGKLGKATKSALESLEKAGPGSLRAFAEFIKRYTDYDSENMDELLLGDMSIQKEFHKIGKSLSECNITPYVIIDEIDRCTPKNVVRFIESLTIFFAGEDVLERVTREKNKMDVEQSYLSPFKFIISIDEDYVVSSFAQIYKLSKEEASTYIAKFIQFRFHFPNKSWQVFFDKLIETQDLKSLFPYQAGCLPELVEIFEIKTPRGARQVLGYLMHWQNRLYKTVGEEQEGVIAEISKMTNKDNERKLINAIVNDLLGIFAAVKLVYPHLVNELIRANILPEFMGKLEPTADYLVKLFEEAMKNKTIDKTMKKKLKKLASALVLSHRAIEEKYFCVELEKERITRIRQYVDKSMSLVFSK